MHCESTLSPWALRSILSSRTSKKIWGLGKVKSEKSTCSARESSRVTNIRPIWSFRVDTYETMEWERRALTNWCCIYCFLGSSSTSEAHTDHYFLYPYMNTRYSHLNISTKYTMLPYRCWLLPEQPRRKQKLTGRKQGNLDIYPLDTVHVQAWKNGPPLWESSNRGRNYVSQFNFWLRDTSKSFYWLSSTLCHHYSTTSNFIGLCIYFASPCSPSASSPKTYFIIHIHI